MKTEYACAQCGASVWRQPSGVIARVFCSRQCSAASNRGKPSKRRPMIGPDHPKWKGGAILQNGYRYLWIPEHPNALPSGYVAEHRQVMADHLGRRLEVFEDVHHRNGDRLDNRLDNLALMTDSAHTSHHQALLRGSWALKHPCCVECGTTERRHFGRGKCTRCYGRAHMAKWRRLGYIAPSRRKPQV